MNDENKRLLETVDNLPSVRAEREARMTPVEKALATVDRLDPQICDDISLAYRNEDYLDAAAVLFDQDPVAFRGLANRLKGRGIRKDDFERKARQRSWELKSVAKAARKAGKSGGGKAATAKIQLHDPRLWEQPVNGAALLDAIVAAVKKFVVLPPLAAETVALWIVHTYLMDAADITPRLAILSPIMRCGKSRVLELIVRLARKPMHTANISVSALFRVIEAAHPTLLMDELDTLGKGDKAEELRGILNAANSRSSAHVDRSVGEVHEPRRFSTWTPIAMAAIGKLPPTWEDRGIKLMMKRKTRVEAVERFNRRARALPIFEELARKAARFAADHLDTLKTAEPELPNELEDRAQDNWEPLLAIADAAGPRWALLARDAARTLSGAESDRSSDDISIQLIADLREIYRERDADFLSSTQVAKALADLEDRPWKTFGKDGEPISTHRVARLLKPFGVIPTLNATRTARGYILKDLDDLCFSRYLPNSADQSVQVSETVGRVGESEISQVSSPDTLKNADSHTESMQTDTRTLSNGKIGSDRKSNGLFEPDAEERFGSDEPDGGVEL